MFKFFKKSSKYDYNSWQSNGKDIWELINEQSEKSQNVIENLIAFTIKRNYENPYVSEVKVNCKAFIGYALECPDKTNRILIPSLQSVINIGRDCFKKGENSEIFSLPSYLRMIESYYQTYYTDLPLWMLWHAFTASTPPDINFENTQIWMIVDFYIRNFEGYLIKSNK